MQQGIALKYAKGDYIAFLDTDDYWDSKKLFLQINYILEKKKFVFSNFIIYVVKNILIKK